jgi:hypothetical protein
MPELKHNFTAGKMNKDLDERLVPNGEYRDAMNVQVRTTEGDDNGIGDSGSVQNIPGNRQIESDVHHEWSFAPGGKGNPPKVIGSVADEKNNKGYFLIAGSDIYSTEVTGNVTESRMFIDTIVEVDTGIGLDSPTVKPVCVDNYASLIPQSKLWGGTTGVEAPDNLIPDKGLFRVYVDPNAIKHIRVGMTMKGISQDYIFNNSVPLLEDINSANTSELPKFRAIIHKIDYDKGIIWFEGGAKFGPDTIINVPGRSTDQNMFQWGMITYFKFEAERVLKFSKNTRISAINVLDGLLFWTDGKTEPKKINIHRSKLGTPNYLNHTQLHVKRPGTNDAFDEIIPNVESQVFNYINSDLKEEHVTVIRIAPRISPTLEMSDSTRGGVVSVSGIVKNFMGDDDSFNPGSSTSTWTDNTVPLYGLNWEVNDIIVFTEQISDVENRSVIKATIDSYDENTGDLSITALSVSADLGPSNASIEGSGVWTVALERKPPMFELKMGRFGVRYKYEDGEYSSFGPWSELAFLPGEYDYNHKKGYNLGMVNTVREIKIKDFIPSHQIRPLDIKAVDILWKTTESPNCYVVKTIQRGIDPEWDNFSTSSLDENDALEFGELTLSSEMIHRVVEKNQLLRAYDNVPKNALAQEIAANRVVYANYTQGYDLTSPFSLKQNLKSDNTSTPTTPKKSVKTLRSYKFGAVFGDRYGRETPVVTGGYLRSLTGDVLDAQAGDIVVDKQFSSMRNVFELKQMWDNNALGGTPDNWIEYVKYYVKETSNEYYNLIMDRWYEAEDGNIWVSFSSSDRNKIDEETYLVLKKGQNTDESVIESARYKVLAIENEPPDFIRVEPRAMGTVMMDSTDLLPDIDGNFGAFSDPVGLDVTSQAPTRLMNSTEFKFTQNWNGFLDNFEPKGDMKIRVIGTANNVTKKGPKWQTVTYHSTTPDGLEGIVRWRKPFGNAAHIIPLFDAASVSTTGLQLGFEFREDVVVTTAAEFEGRFFVKLEKDAVLESKVMQYANDTEYYNEISWNLHYIDNQPVNPASASAVNPGKRCNYEWFNTSGNSSDSSANDLTTGTPSFVTTADANSNQVGIAPLDDYVGCSWTAEDFAAMENPETGNDLTVPEAAHFLALGCKITNADVSPCVNTDFFYNGQLRFRNHTALFWKWFGSDDMTFIDENTMFIDGARTKWAELSGGGNGVVNSGGLNNDGDAQRPYHYYKPTGLDQGYQSGDNFQPTVSGEFGRIAVSFPDKWANAFGTDNTNDYGFGGDGTAFKQFMQGQGNKFRFNADPDGRIYQIVGSYHQMEAYNYGDIGNGNNGVMTGNDLYDYQITGGQPTLINTIQITGIINYSDDADADGSFCGRCNTQDSGSYETSCKRWGFRVEFRLFDPQTGQLVDGGTRGIDPMVWDPRGEVCHDGREALAISKVIPAIADAETVLPTENAACFETEPKEDVGLDLYYSASHAIPMHLKTTNMAMQFVPYHSKVTLRGSTGTAPNANNSETVYPWANGLDHRVFYVGVRDGKAIVGIEAKPSIEDVSETVAETYYPYNFRNFEDSASYIADGTITPESTFVSNSNPRYLEFEHPNGIKTRARISSCQWPMTESESEGAIDWQIGGGSSSVLYPQQWVAFGAEPGDVDLIAYSNLKDLIFRQFNNTNQEQTGSLSASGQVYFLTGFFEIEPEVYLQPIQLGWHNCWSFGNGVESDRIRDDYNAPRLDNGVKVSTTFLEFGEEHKFNGMIYSGIYNSISGVNNLNEFNQAEKITKDLNPIYGSIQALKIRDTDLVAFTEDKLLKVITNKDALFNADGNAQLTATNRVLGTAVPFAGDYGISKNPESLAWDNFRMYFTDMQRGAVLRLSHDGLTPISSVGMKSWFRENLKKTKSLLGTFDSVNGEYNLTLEYDKSTKKTDTTVSFNEGSKGWVSFKSFIPQEGLSVGGKYITAKQCRFSSPVAATIDGFSPQQSYTLWEHNVDIEDTNASSGNFKNIINRNIFYAPTSYIVQSPEILELDNYFTPSHIDVLFNDMANSIKTFSTVSYEGSQGKIIPFTSPEVYDAAGDLVVNYINPDGSQILTDGEYYNLSGKDGWCVSNIKTDQSSSGSVLEFKEKEGKWFNRISGGNYKGKDRALIDNALPEEYLSEFSVQGLGFISSTNQNIGTNVTTSINETNDGNVFTTTTTTNTNDGTDSTTTTVTTTTTTDTDTNTTTTTTDTTTETNAPVWGVVLTPEGQEEGEEIDTDD